MAEFLRQLWPDDEESIAALQEFFAYVLSGRTDLHKIMLLIGPTRSGKGTIARVLAALLGKGNVAGPRSRAWEPTSDCHHCSVIPWLSAPMPDWPAARPPSGRAVAVSLGRGLADGGQGVPGAMVGQAAVAVLDLVQ